jgi:hypothetical protein
LPSERQHEKRLLSQRIPVFSLQVCTSGVAQTRSVYLLFLLSAISAGNRGRHIHSCPKCAQNRAARTGCSLIRPPGLPTSGRPLLPMPDVLECELHAVNVALVETLVDRARFPRQFPCCPARPPHLTPIGRALGPIERVEGRRCRRLYSRDKERACRRRRNSRNDPFASRMEINEPTMERLTRRRKTSKRMAKGTRPAGVIDRFYTERVILTLKLHMRTCDSFRSATRESAPSPSGCRRGGGGAGAGREDRTRFGIY